MSRPTTIKVSSSSGVRTRRVFGWLCVVWFTSAVCDGDIGLKVFQVPEHLACGGNVTLTCKADLPHGVDIKLFSWLTANKTVCQQKDGPPDPDVLCESTSDTQHHNLTLTLLNVMPVNQGRYLCKLRTNMGVKSGSTNVTIQDCFGSSASHINESQAECSFSGVYPRGTVHWLRGDVNLTDSARTHDEKDRHGRYNVRSTIDVQKGHPSEYYNCSLWSPSVGGYVHSRVLLMSSEQRSSGNVNNLQWICLMVGILMLAVKT